MRAPLIILFLLVLVDCWSQSDSTSWSVGPYFEVSYSHSKVHATGDIETYAQQLDSIETGSYFFTYGLLGTRRLNSKCNLSFGLLFDSYGQSIDTLALQELHDLKYSYTTLALPIGLQYNFVQYKKIKPYLTIEMMPSKLTKEKWSYRTFTDNNELEVTLKNNIRPYQIQARVSGGLRFDLHQHYSLGISLGYQRNLLNSSTSAIERYHQKFALGFSLLYHF